MVCGASPATSTARNYTHYLTKPKIDILYINSAKNIDVYWRLWQEGGEEAEAMDAQRPSLASTRE